MNLELHDDGIDADAVSRDGVYSAFVVPASAGRHKVVGTAHGETAAGRTFNRKVAVDFDVYSPRGRILGIVDDRAVDEDLDRVFDRVAVGVNVDIVQEGAYDLYVQLLSAAGPKRTRNTGALNLSTGQRSVTLSFDSSDILGMGGDGPYTFSIVELHAIENTTPTTVDRRAGLGSTRSYTRSQFEVLANGGIAGNVTALSTGQPLAGVVVAVFDINGDQVAEVPTDSTGSYTFDGILHPGPYRAITRNTLGYADMIFDGITCDGTCAIPDRTGSLIIVREGVRTGAIDFTLRVRQ